MPLLDKYGSSYSRLYQVKFFKGRLPQILLGPFLNTLTHMLLIIKVNNKDILLVQHIQHVYLLFFLLTLNRYLLVLCAPESFWYKFNKN